MKTNLKLWIREIQRAVPLEELAAYTRYDFSTEYEGDFRTCFEHMCIGSSAPWLNDPRIVLALATGRASIEDANMHRASESMRKFRMHPYLIATHGSKYLGSREELIGDNIESFGIWTLTRPLADKDGRVRTYRLLEMGEERGESITQGSIFDKYAERIARMNIEEIWLADCAKYGVKF